MDSSPPPRPRAPAEADPPLSKPTWRPPSRQEGSPISRRENDTAATASGSKANHPLATPTPLMSKPVRPARSTQANSPARRECQRPSKREQPTAEESFPAASHAASRPPRVLPPPGRQLHRPVPTSGPRSRSPDRLHGSRSPGQLLLLVEQGSVQASTAEAAPSRRRRPSLQAPAPAYPEVPDETGRVVIAGPGASLLESARLATERLASAEVSLSSARVGRELRKAILTPF